MCRTVTGTVQQIVQVTVRPLANFNAKRLVRAVVVAIVLMDARMVARLVAKQPAKVNARKNVQRPVLIVVLVTVQENAPQLVLTLARLRLHNTVLIVPATVLLDVLLPVQIHVKPRLHKDVQTVHPIVAVSVAAVANPIALVVAA